MKMLRATEGNKAEENGGPLQEKKNMTEKLATLMTGYKVRCCTSFVFSEWNVRVVRFHACLTPGKNKSVRMKQQQRKRTTVP